jgi:hypothetical protein
VRLRPLALAVASGLVCAVSACGGLPSGGPVQQGMAVGEPAQQPIHVSPFGPVVGASAEETIRGFLSAGYGFEDDHAVARSFLTPAASDAWKPDVGVTVHGDTDASVKVTVADGTVRVATSPIAVVDGNGYYHEAPAGSVVRGSFGLVRVGGQWRISSLPNGFGLWLSQYDMQRIYRPFSISYVDPVERTLVADRRWFPVTAGLATTLARAQLDPVPDYLRGAVSTGVPLGTELSVAAVPVQSGRATVDLTVRALAADAMLRRAMWAQFLSTLLQVQLPAVNEVSLRVDGARLDLPGLGESLSSLADLDYRPTTTASPTLVLLRKGNTLTRVDPDGFGDVNPPRRSPESNAAPLPRIQPGWIELAQSRDGKELAAIGGDRRDLSRWRGTTSHQLPAFGDHLTKPSYDGRDGLWVAGERGGATRLWVIDTSGSSVSAGQPRAVDISRLGDRRIVSFRVAADDQRAVLITTKPDGTDVQVQVAGIVRAGNGTAQALAAPLRVGWTLTSASSAVWVDDDTVAVIGRVGRTEPQRPYLVDIGGPATGLQPVPDARSLTTTGGVRGLVVVTGRGVVLNKAGNGWQPLGEGTDLVVPGA